MAKINNQAIMQKLIDELDLYPAKETIPTELAEKILPVFQVNSDDIVVKIEENFKLYQNTIALSDDKTFTVPPDTTWKIKHFAFNLTTDATVATRYLRIIIKDGDGNIIWATEGAQGLTASKSRACFCAENSLVFSTGNQESGGDGLYWFWFVPKDIVLTEGGEIRVYTFSGAQAGDTIETYLTVDEKEI